MSFPKRRLVGDSDYMSWNCPVLRNSASCLVGESLSLGCWQGLEGLPGVGGGSQLRLPALLWSPFERSTWFFFTLSILENLFPIPHGALVESLGNTNKHEEENKLISPRYSLDL